MINEKISEIEPRNEKRKKEMENKSFAREYNKNVFLLRELDADAKMRKTATIKLVAENTLNNVRTSNPDIFLMAYEAN